MAVIMTGKTRLIKAGLVGALIAIVPMLIICAILVFLMSKKDAKLNLVNEELMEYKEGTVCVLANSVKQGQQINSEDIMVVNGKFKGNISYSSKKEFVGKIAKADMKAGDILNHCILAKENGFDDTMRTYYIDYIEIPVGYAEQRCFDIRIRFPNGEDYLVAGNKKIIFRDEGGFYVDLTRREALLLSSAKVDVSIYSGTVLYSAFYASGFDNEEIMTYPVNSYVFSLGQWEPNIKETFPQEMFDKREALEKNLFDFMGVTNNLQ